jgi:hypothetical protein
MERSLNVTYLILMVFTVLTAVVSSMALFSGKILVLIIMALAAAKYLLVAFDFLELKKAHFFWKFVTVLVCLLIVGVVVIFGTA